MKRTLSNLLTLVFLCGSLSYASQINASPAHLAPREETVTFNTQNLKYHRNSCRWAQRCTVNCIKISQSEAIKRGGIPCKVCRP